MPSARLYKGLDLAPAIALLPVLMLTCLGVFERIAPELETLRSAADALCTLFLVCPCHWVFGPGGRSLFMAGAGNLDMVYSIDKSGSPSWTTTVATNISADSLSIGKPWDSRFRAKTNVGTMILAAINLDQLRSELECGSCSLNHSFDSLGFGLSPYIFVGMCCCIAQYTVLHKLYWPMFARQCVCRCCLAKAGYLPNLNGGITSVAGVEALTVDGWGATYNANCADIFSPDSADISLTNARMAASFSDTVQLCNGTGKCSTPSCEKDAKQHCNETNPAGLRARMLCPETCGAFQSLSSCVCIVPDLRFTSRLQGPGS